MSEPASPEPGGVVPPDHPAEPTPQRGEGQPPERATGAREASPTPPEAYRAATAGILGWLRIRERLPAWQRWALGALPVLALLALWWLATSGARPEDRFISPTILPSPLEVARSFESLWFDRALTRNLFISLRRVAGGFLVGMVIALPLGVLMGSFSKVKATFSPLAVLGAYLPIPALVPLTLSLFGIGERQKILFLAMAFLIYLLPLVVAAVDEVDEVYLKTAYTLGASKWQTVNKVLLAISWPDIFRALRLGFGIGWSYILLAEMVDINGGLGDIIITSQRRGPREHIYLVLLVIVGVAFVTDKLWSILGRFLFPYRQEV